MKTNPFPPEDADRHALWEMLVARDINAFVQADWSHIASDFIEEGFMGIDAGTRENPDAWQLGFPDVQAYRDAWTAQALAFRALNWAEDLQTALFRNTVLRDIEVRGNSALAHKKFFGEIKTVDSHPVPTVWQTLYRCRKVHGSWKIAGFTGFMPHYSGQGAATATLPAKSLPDKARQHVTAGPYSPVLNVDTHRMVVISGQAAIDVQGNVIGESIEEQATLTLENCRKQLSVAGCTLDDVFKVTVYMKDLADWPRFNNVYETWFEEPRPVRTAVQTGLLPGLLVEIELWATRS